LSAIRPLVWIAQDARNSLSRAVDDVDGARIAHASRADDPDCADRIAFAVGERDQAEGAQVRVRMLRANDDVSPGRRCIRSRDAPAAAFLDELEQGLERAGQPMRFLGSDAALM
jgi:hypothetical protein